MNLEQFMYVWMKDEGDGEQRQRKGKSKVV